MVSTPHSAKNLALSRLGLGPHVQVFAHVKADAARADHGHALAHRLLVAQHVQVAQHLGVVDASISGRRGLMPVASTTCWKPALHQVVGTTRWPSFTVTPVCWRRSPK